MPAVAEVQFKAAGSQQVVSAFNSVGTAAQTSSTKVQQNSTAMSSLGKGMKSSVAGIGQVTTAFATLSLSIVNTYRSYRDLGDAQLQVDRANLKVSKTQNAIRLLEKDIAKDRKAGAKGSLDYAIASNKIAVAEQKLAKDRKDGKHTTAELKGEELAIAKMRKEGVGNTQQLSDKETKLQLLREQLGVATTNAGEAQERFNDIQQNFYLSIAPLAISTIGTLTTAFSGLKGMLTGGGGLIGGLGPIGLILGGITLAIIAFKTNFLGLRDAIGGAIKWIQDRFGAWKDTIQQIFGLIQKGDWAGVFNLIRVAAVKFWIDLKRSVPFFGTLETIVNAIKEGKWSVAFDAIKKAAEAWWKDMKKAVPFLADLEKFLDDIQNAKWDEVFKTIAKAAKAAFDQTIGVGIEWLLGKNWKLGLEAKMLEVENEAKQRGTSVPIEIAREINVSIIKVTGIDVAKWFKEHPLTTEVIPLSLGGISLAIEDPTFQAALAKGAKIIIDALGAALAAGAKILDPYVAKLVSALSWDNLVTAVNTAGAKIKQAWKENAPDTQQAIIENWKKSPLARGLAGLGIKFKPEVDMTDVSKK